MKRLPEGVKESMLDNFFPSPVKQLQAQEGISLDYFISMRNNYSKHSMISSNEIQLTNIRPSNLLLSKFFRSPKNSVTTESKFLMWSLQSLCNGDNGNNDVPDFVVFVIS